jgi:L-Ala-D/L-Glu epimerase
MKLEVSLERWPYRTPFRISRGVEAALDVLLVTLHDERGHAGRGEAAGVDYAGETMQSMQAQLETLTPALESGLSRAELQPLLPAGGARNALDCALWDLEAKATGVPVWTRLALAPRPVTTCFTLGIDSLDALRGAARAARHMPLLKVKVDARQHLAAVRVVHEECPQAALVVDANQAWSVGLLNELATGLQQLGVVLIEQPVPVAEEDGLRNYRGRIPLAADESVADRRSLDALSSAYHYVNIKLDKSGGLTEALALAQAARERGYGIMAGCMAGTSLAMAPAMVLAQSARFVDLDGPLLHTSDRTPHIEYRGAVMQIPPAELWG